MKVHIGNMVAEVESERDIELLKKLVSSTQSALSNGSHELLRETVEIKPDVAPIPSREVGAFETAFNAWRKRLHSESQERLLKQLASEPRWFADKELCAALGFAKIGQLSGVLCGFSRHAKGVKLKPAEIFQKRMEKTPEGERVHSYRLSPKAYQALERTNGESQMT